MIPNTDKARSRQEDIVVQEMPDEVLVYDLRRHKGHCLNQTAAFVWNRCDGETTAAEIAAQMSAAWHKPIGEEVVWLALQQLEKAELLQHPITKPDDIRRVSRRAALRGLGMAATVALPLVMSVIAPTAVQAGASVPAPCAACVKKAMGVGACPVVCGANVVGRCYDNSGCGKGQALGCDTCVGCLAGGSDRSWVAPGDPAC